MLGSLIKFLLVNLLGGLLAGLGTCAQVFIYLIILYWIGRFSFSLYYQINPKKTYSKFYETSNLSPPIDPTDPDESSEIYSVITKVSFGAGIFTFLLCILGVVNVNIVISILYSWWPGW